MAVLALGLGYFALRTALVGGVGRETNPDIMENPFVGADFQEKYATIGVILWKYFSLLFWPHPLSSDYSFNQIPRTHFGDPLALLGWTIHIGLFAAAIWGLRKKAVWAWGIMLYLAPFGLVSNILFNIGAPMGERFLYLGSFGACLALSQGLLYRQKTWTEFRAQPLLGIGLLAVAALFAVLTFQRNKAWYNNETLFSTDVKHSPNSAKVHYYYANTLLQKFLNSPKDRRNPALLDQAEKGFARSVAINPNFHTAWYNVGLVAFEKGDGNKAKAALLQTLQLQPKHLNSTELLAKVYARFYNQPDSALLYQERFVYEWKQETPESLKNLAILYSMKNQMDKATPLFEKAIQLAPNDAGILFNYGVALQSNGYMAKGTELIQRAQQLDPSLGR
jgi:Tfp pilus assembly protein PilF